MLMLTLYDGLKIYTDKYSKHFSINELELNIYKNIGVNIKLAFKNIEDNFPEFGIRCNTDNIKNKNIIENTELYRLGPVLCISFIWLTITFCLSNFWIVGLFTVVSHIYAYDRAKTLSFILLIRRKSTEFENESNV